MKRASDEPAFVLHRYAWSESSLILELLTRHFGRVAVVAKGARRPSSNFRPVLLPMQPLNVAFGGDAEIRTLRSAEWVGGQVMPGGDALLSGYYLNELVLLLVPREDPHPQLFDAYAAAVGIVAAGDAMLLEPALRAFELVLLREAGLLPALDAQTATLAPLDPAVRYRLVPEGGLVEAEEEAAQASLAGAAWLEIERAMEAPAPFAALLAGPAAAAGLKPQLRALLHYHCGVQSLRTRQMMVELQGLQKAQP